MRLVKTWWNQKGYAEALRDSLRLYDTWSNSLRLETECMSIFLASLRAKLKYFKAIISKMRVCILCRQNWASIPMRNWALLNDLWAALLSKHKGRSFCLVENATTDQHYTFEIRVCLVLWWIEVGVSGD